MCIRDRVYTNKDEYWTLQYFLRAVVLERMISQYSTKMMVGMREVEIPEENFRMAAIVLTAGPIVLIYPFVQKYFVKGIITGAVKE